VVLSPTRELAMQTLKFFKVLTKRRGEGGKVISVREYDENESLFTSENRNERGNVF
jgi:hypothetical protein